MMPDRYETEADLLGWLLQHPARVKPGAAGRYQSLFTVPEFAQLYLALEAAGAEGDVARAKLWESVLDRLREVQPATNWETLLYKLVSREGREDAAERLLDQSPAGALIRAFDRAAARLREGEEVSRVVGELRETHAEAFGLVGDPVPAADSGVLVEAV